MEIEKIHLSPQYRLGSCASITDFQMVEALNALANRELQHIDAFHQGFFERCTNGNNLLANGNGRILNVGDFIKPNDKGPVYADEGITLQSVR